MSGIQELSFDEIYLVNCVINWYNVAVSSWEGSVLGMNTGGERRGVDGFAGRRRWSIAGWCNRSDHRLNWRFCQWCNERDEKKETETVTC